MNKFSKLIIEIFLIRQKINFLAKNSTQKEVDFINNSQDFDESYASKFPQETKINKASKKDDNQLADLKSAIENGSYVIDSNRIASKIINKGLGS